MLVMSKGAALRGTGRDLLRGEVRPRRLLLRRAARRRRVVRQRGRSARVIRRGCVGRLSRGSSRAAPIKRRSAGSRRQWSHGTACGMGRDLQRTQVGQHSDAGRGDPELADAHRRAVSRALAELEQHALSRRNGGSEWVSTSNIVAASFDHIAARPSQGIDDGYGPDPHLRPTSSSRT